MNEPPAQQRTVVLQDEALRRLRGVTAVANAVLRHPKLSHGTKLTYGVLLSYSWQDDFCWPAQERLAKDMNCSIRQVQRFLVELKRFNFIDWKQQGLNRPNVYYILPLPESATESGTQKETTLRLFFRDFELSCCRDSLESFAQFQCGRVYLVIYRPNTVPLEIVRVWRGAQRRPQLI